jgi:hypothetical protein
MHPIKMTVNQIEPVRISRYELKQGGKGRLVAARQALLLRLNRRRSFLSLRLIA